MARDSTLERAKKAGREKQVRVIEACEKFWDLQEQGKKDKSACNKFVLAVTEELKIPLKGPLANDIFDEVAKGGIWRQCGHGARDARTVGLLARSGQFVLAVTKEKKGHGHVAVVVDWDEVRVRPRAYWGQLDKGGKKDEVLSQSWSAHRLAPGFYTFTYDEFKKNPGIATPYDHVYFYCTDVP